jgi:hypothetical protein
MSFSSQDCQPGELVRDSALVKSSMFQRVAFSSREECLGVPGAQASFGRRLGSSSTDTFCPESLEMFVS